MATDSDSAIPEGTSGGGEAHSEAPESNKTKPERVTSPGQGQADGDTVAAGAPGPSLSPSEANTGLRQRLPGTSAANQDEVTTEQPRSTASLPQVQVCHTSVFNLGNMSEL